MTKKPCLMMIGSPQPMRTSKESPVWYARVTALAEPSVHAVDQVAPQ